MYFNVYIGKKKQNRNVHFERVRILFRYKFQYIVR